MLGTDNPRMSWCLNFSCMHVLIFESIHEWEIQVEIYSYIVDRLYINVTTINMELQQQREIEVQDILISLIDIA